MSGTKSAKLQFLTHAIFVNRLEQTRSQLTMYFDRRADNAFGQIL